MMILGGIITMVYLVLIAGFTYGFDKIKTFQLKGIPSKTKFSIVIPFRNEAKNLPALLQSIEGLNYPKDFFEVILINDASEDDSVKIIETFLKKYSLSIKVIPNERKTESPKKDAITSAISKTQNDWIITTDADCILPKHWLDSFDEFIQNNDTSCIAAPVMYAGENSFLNRFQILDLLSLQGATIGGFGINKPFLCNGANFAYKKSLFYNLNGFEGNSDIASGDDIFFLEKVLKKLPEQLHYLKCKDAIVDTLTQPSWGDLISQRVRWASKTSAYNNWFGKFAGLFVLLMNGLLIVSFFLFIVGSFAIEKLLSVIIVKFIVDFVLIFKSAKFFIQNNILKGYLVGFFFYPFFSIYIAGISMFSKYKWKERTFYK